MIFPVLSSFVLKKYLATKPPESILDYSLSDYVSSLSSDNLTDVDYPCFLIKVFQESVVILQSGLEVSGEQWNSIYNITGVQF